MISLHDFSKTHRSISTQVMLLSGGLGDKLLREEWIPEIEEKERTSAGPLLVPVDFSRIDWVEVDFMRALVIQLQRHIRQHKTGKWFMYVVNMEDNVRRNLEAAILYEHQTSYVVDSAVPVVLDDKRDGKWRAIPRRFLEPQVENVFDYVAASPDKVTVKDLAAYLQTSANNASNRLKKLYDMALILRKQDTDGLYAYFLPKR